ncbi:NodT family efflux transporter outer membrane factor (OMF) lipoprotein [Pasteurella langaaensis DSM 22999]|uniref:NodT family efflux transporter outer membrane factor (OMF) lipoprotein n=1 Tax=Alitibacter langaaensis DSM 22999 TaxID=1122935 RepID=A0A2U0TA30_9PAST|nr:efflux transporter outer membrane subunit [Pasteurella langaaensis]PVX40465.1 NodT family efflux transporter outer membrane factor (OMF) lipoprotein [Pasteurella langaaensis DSM 22999]
MNAFKLTNFAILVAILTACSTTNINSQSQVNLPSQFEYAQGNTTAAELKKWWDEWQDLQLTQLIEQGLSHNLDIALAKARLQEAMANSDYADSDRGINIGANANLGGSVSKVNTDIINTSTTRAGTGSVGFRASWEPDFFGQKRSDADAAKAIALSQQQQVYATQLLISSQITDNYLRIFAIEQQRKIVANTLTQLKQLQQYINGRFQSGQASAYEVNEINSQISGLDAKQATLKAQRDRFQRNIAVLIGQTPQGFKINIAQNNPLLHIPQAPKGLYPSDLISNRPDIQAHAEQVKAYSAKLASAKADLYPRFDINFLGQAGRIEVNNDLSHLSGLGGLISAGVQLPIFTNGRIQANIDASDARLKGALIEYDKSLLNALAEVDTAYQMQYSLSQQTRLLQKAYAQSNQRAKDAETLFKYGKQTLDTALRAKISALDYQQQLVQSQLEQAQNLVGLYKALGAGWQK